MPVLPLARRIRVRRTSLPADRENHSLRRGLKPGLCISLGAELQVETVLCTVQALEFYVEIGAGHSLSARAHRSHVLIRRRTVARSHAGTGIRNARAHCSATTSS
jgi:hypothetical protein